MNVHELLQKVYEYLAEYGLRVVGALALFVVGRWVANVLSRLAAKALKTEMDNINKSVSALKERLQIYLDKLKEKGGDLSGLQI